MNDHSAATVELPRTAYLDHTLRRARSAAEQRSHRYVTLEHLLFTLLDDPDASRLLTTVGADVSAIRAGITDTVNNRMGSLVVPDGRPPNFSYKFDTLFLAASQDAARVGRRDIDGALALLAVAREPESNASAILIANGFNPAAALHSIAASRPSQTPSDTATPAPVSPRIEPQSQMAAKAPPPAARNDATDDDDDGMDDMLTSVRDILEAEQKKETALSASPAQSRPSVAPVAPVAPSLGPALPAQTPPAPALGSFDYRDTPRAEPGFGNAEGWQAAAPLPSGPELRMDLPQTPPAPHDGLSWGALNATPAAGSHDFGSHDLGSGFAESAGPAFDLERQPASRSGFAEPSSPGFDLERPAPPPPPRKPAAAEPGRAPAPADAKGERRAKKRPRNADGATGLLAKVLQPIPRKTRIAVPETVELLLSKDEAWALFARPRPQGAEAGPHAPVRAVTIRLTAPEGGFFIEGQSQETQWLLDRPTFLAEEHFGHWVWLVVPNDTGQYSLVASIFARDIDANGAATDIHIPDQIVKVQVRGNFWRGFGSFVRTVLLLAAGGGIGAAAYYGLKMMGKVP